MADYVLALHADGTGQRLQLEGRLGLECAAELHRLATAALEATGPVQVDWSAAEHLDGATLQILAMLRRELCEAHRAWTTAAAPAAVCSALRWSGMDFLAVESAAS